MCIRDRVQTADGAEGSGPWAGEGAGSPGTHGAEAGPNTETESARAEVERPGYFVHICGQVKEPGVYELPEGSRVYEAVEAAGGFTEEAAAEALNLAEKITDGMKITVYDREEARTLEASGTSEGGGPGSSGLVNLNTDVYKRQTMYGPVSARDKGTETAGEQRRTAGTMGTDPAKTREAEKKNAGRRKHGRPGQPDFFRSWEDVP